MLREIMLNCAFRFIIYIINSRINKYLFQVAIRGIKTASKKVRDGLKS